MARKIDWESQVGRRLKLRDLHVFFTVVQRGSMAKAAAQLGVSQPAVSELIAALEHTVGARLLDRKPQGVEPTIYGHALLKRSLAAFDELKQGIRDIEFLADPTAGEVRIGCPESTASALLPPIIQKFSRQYPRVVLHVEQLVTSTLELPALRERSLDVVIAHLVRPLEQKERDDLHVQTLYDDHSVVVAGKRSPWARRSKVDLAELINESWILPPPNSWNHMIVAEAFRARGLEMPKACLTTLSVHLRAGFLAIGPYITVLPNSVLRVNRFPLKILPINLPVQPWPIVIITLKNRTLSPIVQIFIDHLRMFTNSMATGLKPEKKAASAKALKAAATARLP
jgi:DNA-binding transcriptional LysR family regulator